LKQQDNDLIILRDPAAAEKFETRFAEIYSAAEPMHIEAGKRPSPPQSASAPNQDCPIKGNVNGKGERIYHMPGDRDYDRIVMDLSKGKRWFCSEAEAEAAGWRRSHY
jgi:hypothetical protein